MSDRDQRDDEFVEESAARTTSGTMDSDSERDSDLPSFDAYGDEENWSALEDDESLGSEPEWAEEPSISEEVFDGSEREPEQGVNLRDNADESDSLFDDDDLDDDLDDDNVTLGSSRSSEGDPGSDPSDGSAVDEFDAEEDEDAATPRDQEAIDDDDDDDDDYYRPQPSAASRLKPKKEKKTHWAWPTSVGLLTLAVIGIGGFAWYQSTQQEQALRSMQLKLRQAQQTAQAAAPAEPAENEGQIQALLDELDSTRSLHRQEIAELEVRNQTLEAKLSSVERALQIARADAAKSSNTDTPPSLASSPQPQASSSSGWFINVQTYATRADAEAMVAQLSSSSEAFIVQPAQVNGRTLYRVRASGYASQSIAEEVAAELVEAFALPEPWIGRDR